MGATDENIKKIVEDYFKNHPQCGMVFIIPKTLSLFTVKKYADISARKLGKELPLVFDRNSFKNEAKAIKLEAERIEAEEAERIEAERIETEEAERIEAERIEAEKNKQHKPKNKKK